MIGIDTNVLVRFITQDDARQAAAASRLIEGSCTEDSPGFIAHIVLAELCWVLQRGYRYPKESVIHVLDQLFATAELRIQSAENAWAALREFRAGEADYADYLIGRTAHTEGCETTWTFDRKAARSPLFEIVGSKA